MSKLVEMFKVMGSAIRAAAAVDVRRMPTPSDLRRLGMNEAQMRQILGQA